jgi:hypothetical protein
MVVVHAREIFALFVGGGTRRRPGIIRTDALNLRSEGGGDLSGMTTLPFKIIE